MPGIGIFVAAYAMAVAVPGPGIAAMLGRILAKGLRGIPAFIAGLMTGDLIWFTVAVTGLAAVAAAYHPLILFIRYAGAAYLLFVGLRLATARLDTKSASEPGTLPVRAHDFTSGLAVSVGNPKVIVFFVALLPTVIDLNHVRPWDAATLALTMVLILAGILGGYALLASRSRRLFRNPEAMRVLNLCSGIVICSAALAIAVN